MGINSIDLALYSPLDFQRFLNPYRWPLSAVGRFRLGGQVWLGIENIKLKETANAVKQLPLKPAILNRVGSD